MEATHEVIRARLWTKPHRLQAGGMWHIHGGDCDVEPGNGWHCPYPLRREAKAAIMQLWLANPPKGARE